jgi:hypothetical protein
MIPALFFGSLGPGTSGGTRLEDQVGGARCGGFDWTGQVGEARGLPWCKSHRSDCREG